MLVITFIAKCLAIAAVLQLLATAAVFMLLPLALALQAIVFACGLLIGILHFLFKLLSPIIRLLSSALNPLFKHFGWIGIENEESQGEAHENEEVLSAFDSLEFDPYRVLEVAKGVSPEELLAAYRRKMKTNHPDKVAHMDPVFQAIANTRAKEIQRAYESLRDYNLRF